MRKSAKTETQGPSLQTIITKSTGAARAAVERFTAQKDFATGLAELHKKESGRWNQLIARAQAVVARAAVGGSAETVSAAVREAEGIMAPIGKVAKTYTSHLVGHAHIDMNWMWGWPETVAVTNDTFSTILRLLDEYPEFRFSQSQASVYAIIEKHNPEMLKRIKSRVAEGRWEVTASHWVEGDKNMAGGESLCRHLLYTRRYMQELFGLAPEDVNIDWSPDTFGHAATMPTYLVRGGVKYLYMHRPGVHTPSKPQAFWWRAPDGSQVLVQNDMKYGYNCMVDRRLADMLLLFAKETGCRDRILVYGIGDHGGGPTRRDIASALEMDRWPVFPNVVFSTAREYFNRLEAAGAKLPTIEGELNTEFAGCYTSQSLIKKGNRLAENSLADAEAASALVCQALGGEHPAAALLEGWRDTLFGHFHDILPGSGVHDTRTYHHGLFQKTMASTSMIETLALRRLAAAVDTGSQSGEAASGTAIGGGVGFGSALGGLSGAEQSSGRGERPFVIYNPSTWERSEVVTVSVWDSTRRDPADVPLKERSFVVRTPDGEVLATQKTGSGDYWGHHYVNVAFPVKVPALGYALYTVVEGAAQAATTGTRQTSPAHHCFYASKDRPREGFENEHLRVEIDPKTGGISSLVMKSGGVELISPKNPAPPAEMIVERANGMSAWVIGSQLSSEQPRSISIQPKQNGPYVASIEVEFLVSQSQFTLTYELRSGDPRLHVSLKGTWFERGTKETGIPSLSYALPFALTDASARYEIPFGAVDRTLNRGEEVPALNWAQVTGKAGGKRAGCLLANDSKHGYSLDGGTLRLTLIRSSYHPDTLPEIGQHEVRLALMPFAGELPVDAATRAGAELNHALRAVGTDVHSGRLDATASLVNIRPATVMLSGLKRAEDSSALVLRVYESTGKKATVRLGFDKDLLGTVTKAVEVDLLERPVRKSSARVAAGNAVELSVPAHGIATVMVTLRRP